VTKLDIYKITTLIVLDTIGLTFITLLWLYLDSLAHNLIAAIYYLLISFKYFIALQIIHAMEETGEFKDKLDFLNKFLQYVLVVLLSFAVLLYCVIKIIGKVI